MATKKLSPGGWRRQDEYLTLHPELRGLLRNRTSLQWALRIHREALKPYLGRVGKALVVHDDAAPVLASVMVVPLDDNAL
jgi:hypothetical protein